MPINVVSDHRVNIACDVSAERVIQVYLHEHGIVGLLELVHDVVGAAANPNGDSTGRRHYKAASLLDELLDAV